MARPFGRRSVKLVFVVAKSIIAGLVLLTGCVAAVSDAEQIAPPASVEDVSGAESPSPPTPTGPAAAVDAPLLSWGFEPASADCNGWPVLGADAIRASPARSGAYSCKICSNGSANELSLVRDLGGVPAGRYVLTAWVRKRPQNAAPSEALARIDAATTGGVLAMALAPTVSVREEWDRLEATLQLDTAASNLRVTIGSPRAEVDRCLFVDDVMLIRQR
jgi:hypothetical protein